MSSLKDASGNTVKYNYNETKGTLDSVTDPKQNTTSYTYDSNLDTLQSVSKKVDGAEVKNSYTYDNDKIKSITHNGFNYNFGYDSLGNNTTVSVGNQNLITNNYEPRTGKLLDSTYGNGTKVSQVYDNLDRPIEKVVNGETQFKYEYDANGNLAYKEDLVNWQNFRYIYDLSDRLTEIKNGDYSFAKYSYDDNNNISKVAVGGSTPYYSASYEYDKDNRNTKTTTFNGGTISNSYDALGRLASKAINGTVYNTSYNYKGGMNGATTTQLESVNNNGSKISYTYDANGNIETITDGTNVTKYTYNELNEVTREDNGTLNKSIVYSYDVGGNIVSKTEYPYSIGVLGTATSTINYSYGDANWKDKLTAYNGKAITYDAIGNPLTYDGNTFTWESGRQLSGVSMNNGQSVSYKYNDAGIRVSKTYGYAEGTTQYTLLGDKVIAEGNADGDDFKYNYDASGKLISMIFENQEYFYVRNGQSDIIGLLDKTGNQVVGYTYDSWGKLLSTTGSLKDTLGRKNPYRYRGYRYDSDTGLYYLNSRYYNPEWGRFLNADGIAGKTGELLSHNMFAYCTNNPVNSSDPTGYFAIAIGEAVLVGIAVIAAAVVAYVPVKRAFGAIVTSVGSVIQHAASSIGSYARELAQAKPISNKKPSHNVYVLTDPRRKARYVGRTSQTTLARYLQHQRTGIGTGLSPHTIAAGVDYATARGVEQIVYDHYRLAGNDLRNSIRPISPINPNKWYYMAKGAEYFDTHPEEMWQVIGWDEGR